VVTGHGELAEVLELNGIDHELTASKALQAGLDLLLVGGEAVSGPVHFLDGVCAKLVEVDVVLIALPR